MKTSVIVLTGMLALSTAAVAQDNNVRNSKTGSGPGAASGDPASAAPHDGASHRSNPSGSGTSSSGGVDRNNDRGRDKMGTTGSANPADETAGRVSPTGR